jgi:hypothetical protein
VWLSNVILPHIHVEGLGHIPVASLAGGTMCLLITVVLYAATSQPHSVWISCAAIFVVMLTGSLVPDTDPHSKLIPVQMPVPNRFGHRAQACLSLQSRRRDVTTISSCRAPGVFSPRREACRRVVAHLHLGETASLRSHKVCAEHNQQSCNHDLPVPYYPREYSIQLGYNMYRLSFF